MVRKTILEPHRPIYLDYNATTPVDPRVMSVMLPYFTEKFGNAASRTHAYGWEAERAVEKAREQIAALIHAESPKSIVFTSGATEANNMVIKGIQEGPSTEPRASHIITQKTEHRCVLESCKEMENRRLRVTYLDVDPYGRVDPEAVAGAMTAETVLVSIMAANNEIGTLQPIAEIAKVAHRHPGVLFHTDAAQAVGKIPVDVIRDEIDLLSISGHKFYGPKGIGALYTKPKRPPIHLSPLFSGGGQESNRRSGTLAVPLIVGLGEAARIAQEEMGDEAKRLHSLRRSFIESLTRALPSIHLNGHPDQCLPGTSNVSFQGANAQAMIAAMPELAVSAGSACGSAELDNSYVIRALGKDDSESAIRFGFGRFTRPEDVTFAAELIIKTMRDHRQKARTLLGPQVP